MRFNYSQHSHSMATLKTQTLDIMKKVLFAIILLALTAMGYAQTQQKGYVKTKEASTVVAPPKPSLSWMQNELY